jgi:hypothetical protein
LAQFAFNYDGIGHSYVLRAIDQFEIDNSCKLSERFVLVDIFAGWHVAGCVCQKLKKLLGFTTRVIGLYFEQATMDLDIITCFHDFHEV